MTSEQTALGFARLVVTDESESHQIRVDLAAGARLLRAESSEYGSSPRPWC
ncbi:MAG: hypothetical protein GY724_01520 [Actinomycetia bacterium]|nr:hypothetical protein [Actinomycetes bacterium]MCP4225110.1 hypothetical protein [Actinomycetes bacterium]MCP5030296.1 hypothetical protein [Actinomycetes bacterium]